MRPISTTYRLARAGGEFNKLYALAKKEGSPLPAGTLNFPTVLAERDGELLGFLSTNSEQWGVVAGPLFMKHKNLLTIIRLGEAYEVVLRAAKVRTYFVQVAREWDKYADYLVRAGYNVVHQDEKNTVMRKDL